MHFTIPAAAWAWCVPPLLCVLAYLVWSHGLYAFWSTRDPRRRKAIRAAARIRRNWPRTATKLGLVERGPRQEGKNPRVPPFVSSEPGAEMTILEFRTVHGVGRAEFEQLAGALVDAWHVQSVRVRQTTPGRVRVRIIPAGLPATVDSDRNY